MEMKDEFLKRIDHFKSEEAKNKKSYGLISLLRFAAFILAACFTYLVIKSLSIFMIFGTVLSYILFIYLLSIHSKISYNLLRIKNMIEVNEKYLKRLDGTWTSFEDCGIDKVDEEKPYLTDLDILGEKSLFQLINTTKTFFGREKLIAILKNPDKDINKIKERQEAVRELGEKLDFTQKIEGEGIINKNTVENPTQLLDYVENLKRAFSSPIAKIISWVVPVITIITSIIIVYYKLDRYYGYIGLFFTIHLLINGIGYAKISPVLGPIYKRKNDLESYFNILKLIENEEFKSSYLKELKEKLIFDGKSANTILKELTSIVERIEYTSNIIGYVILSVIFFWDYHRLFEFENWKSKYGKYIREWLDVIGEFESLSSLSAVFHLNSKLTFPEFSKEQLVFSGKEIGHPLIDEKTRIYNDVDMTDSIFIITGSNMSGKTTFLRTVGINLVLAYAGAPVCGKKLTCSVVDIYTSMRITDDLNRGMSTFYVELIRMKKMIENIKTKHPMIFLIDEIFRGTNSNDRIVGAKSVLKSLNEKWVFGLISTHDFELCNLEYDDKNRIKNYHFSESYEGNKIKFDYKLKKGRSDTTNAKYLMKMIGIDIIE
ncbi:MutS family DNA mismatch repair protein [Clostridium guangxiense]|uniref:MutS family DNA mismatch repair protein n=1 Tax=Clostridium guangxiense TaxID=1662055 RepID=UPI0038B3821A|nr:MutS family DNA mismatch repair protein [Clostridium guangxiense]